MKKVAASLFFVFCLCFLWVRVGAQVSSVPGGAGSVGATGATGATGASAAPAPLVNTSNHLITSSDCGNLVIANPTLTTVTLPASPPTMTCVFKVQNYTSSGITLNAATNGATIKDYTAYSGSMANRTVASGSGIVVETDGAGSYLVSYYDLQGLIGPTGPQGATGPTGPSSGYSGPSTCNVVTGSRVSGTAYQNTTGNPMWVTVTAYNTPGNDASMTAYSDSSATPTANVDSSNVYIPSTNDPIASVHPLVLAGNYYKVTIAVGTLNTWVECH